MTESERAKLMELVGKWRKRSKLDYPWTTAYSAINACSDELERTINECDGRE